MLLSHAGKLYRTLIQLLSLIASNESLYCSELSSLPWRYFVNEMNRFLVKIKITGVHFDGTYAWTANFSCHIWSGKMLFRPIIDW